ncbi:MAG: F0F1 ATP synthase subunit delta [Planctomycetaceae bacterium]
MSPTLTTFLFEAANFLTLAAVLAWLFFRPVRQALRNRCEKMELEEQQTAEKLADAQRMQQEINASRDNLQQELNATRDRELKATRQQAQRIVADARKAADHELELARRQSVRMSETQQETLARVAAHAAADAVGHLLQQIAGPDLHDALVESACRQIGILSADRLGTVKVESARELSEQQRASLTQALGSAGPGADFRTMDDLRAGVRILTADGLIDASVGGLTGFARQSLVRELNHHANNHNPLRDTST